MHSLPSCALRVLVVDDDPSSRALVCSTLQGHGFLTTEAQDGQAALGLFQESKKKEKQSIDAVITDFDMPHVNGVDVIRSIRTEDENIPVVLITAGMPEHRLLELLVYERFAALQKPFCPSKLVNATRHVIGSPLSRSGVAKRQAARIPIDIACKIEGVGKAVLQNLSLGGAFVTSDFPILQIGEELTLHLKYKTKKSHSLILDADVRWMDPQGMGIRFIRMDEKQLLAIHEILLYQLTEEKVGWFRGK